MIVSDEPILDTMEKLWKTNKQFCLALQEDIDMFLGSKKMNKNSIEYLIHRKLISQKRQCCLLDYATEMKEVPDNFVIVYGENFMSFLKMFNGMARSDIFIGAKPFFTTLLVYFFSKSMNERAKAEVNRQANIYSEHGFAFKMLREYDVIIDQNFPRIKSTFRSAKEYVDRYTSISDVQMNDFTFVYLFYIVWFVTLLVFALHVLIRRKSRRSHNGTLMMPNRTAPGIAQSNLFEILSIAGAPTLPSDGSARH